MKLKNLLTDDLNIGPCVLGIGMFDGVHLGHQKLINDVSSAAKELDLPSVIFTFDHSPRKLISPAVFKGYLTSPDEKFALLSASNIDYVVFRPFDEQFAKMSCRSFVKDILIDTLNVNTVVVGFNFFFGAGRQGNADSMRNELAKYGRKCFITQPVSIDGQLVSSSIIREAVSNGDFERASKFLGREACFTGVVAHGDHRGREMGFPTANLKLADSMKILPPNGVYACYVDTDNGTFSAMVNVGTRPTFNKSEHLLEANLLDFSGDLYHQTIRVRFVKQLRSEKRFSGMQALISQLHHDRAECHQILG